MVQNTWVRAVAYAVVCVAAVGLVAAGYALVRYASVDADSAAQVGRSERGIGEARADMVEEGLSLGAAAMADQEALRSTYRLGDDRVSGPGEVLGVVLLVAAVLSALALTRVLASWGGADGGRNPHWRSNAPHPVVRALSEAGWEPVGVGRRAGDSRDRAYGRRADYEVEVLLDRAGGALGVTVRDSTKPGRTISRFAANGVTRAPEELVPNFWRAADELGGHRGHRSRPREENA